MAFGHHFILGQKPIFAKYWLAQAILRDLRAAWKNHISSLPQSQNIDSIPPSQWDRIDVVAKPSKAKRKAFTELLVMIYAHLPPQEAVILVEAMSKLLRRDDDSDTALGEALIPREEQRAKNRGFIAGDWKATDEVQWQADALCRAHGVVPSWQAPTGTLTILLQSFGDRLKNYRLQLLCFSVGDSFFAFAIPTAKTDLVIALGKQLKIHFRSAGDG